MSNHTNWVCKPQASYSANLCAERFAAPRIVLLPTSHDGGAHTQASLAERLDHTLNLLGKLCRDKNKRGRTGANLNGMTATVRLL